MVDGWCAAIGIVQAENWPWIGLSLPALCSELEVPKFRCSCHIDTTYISQLSQLSQPHYVYPKLYLYKKRQPIQYYCRNIQPVVSCTNTPDGCRSFFHNTGVHQFSNVCNSKWCDFSLVATPGSRKGGLWFLFSDWTVTSEVPSILAT